MVNDFVDDSMMIRMLVNVVQATNVRRENDGQCVEYKVSQCL